MKTEFLTIDTTSASEIKERRESLGLTQKEFAILVGTSKPTVERWESSNRPITGPIAVLLPMLTSEYVEKRRIPEKSTPIRMWYMHGDNPCTLIDVDEKNRKVRIVNYAINLQFMAFGCNQNPSYDDYLDFLKSRCFPETRDKLKIVLEDLDIPFYDPYLIIKKTKGRMAEDNFWLKIEAM